VETKNNSKMCTLHKKLLSCELSDYQVAADN